ncbi:MAG: hypothetical protein JST93_18370 [Acidobacteria bacterium]|nr:hypothetical protein [Acidobacteriota bacterium]
MTPTPAQQNAARQNGSLSHGPVTEAGKATSSQNARKHNFFTDTALLPSDDREVFLDLLRDYTREFKPTTLTEIRYIREMADAEFRLRRVREYTAQIEWKTMQSFPDPVNAGPDAFHKLANESKVLQLALRYERHFQRQFDSALKIFLQLRRQAETRQKADAKAAQAAHLKALEDYFLSPTPGELYGYGDESTPLQNEPNHTPQRN